LGARISPKIKLVSKQLFENFWKTTEFENFWTKTKFLDKNKKTRQFGDSVLLVMKKTCAVEKNVVAY